MMRLAWALPIGLLAAGACTVGPNYVKPETQTPEGWSSLDPQAIATQPAGPTTQPSPQPADAATWWKELSDPTLDSLINRAIESNLTLKVATARVREARAFRTSVAADLWPQIASSGSYRYSGASQNTGPKSSDPSVLKDARNTAITTAAQGLIAGQGIDPATVASSAANRAVTGVISNKLADDGQSHRGSNLFQAGFDASWEIDVFGGIRRGVEAAEAEIQAAVEDERSVLVSLIAEVALNYVELRGFQRRLEIALDNIEIQRNSLALTEQRFGAGFAAGLDVAQARSQLASTTSQVPALMDAIRRSIYQLSVLLGQTPDALVAELEQAAPIPANPPDVPIGLPSDLLRRRPDIRFAERQLAAATARIGEATADLFPRFSLNGSFGLASRNINNLVKRDSILWSVGPAVSWPVFQGGRILANIEIQNAVQEQAFATYQQTVLTAFQEVETALSAYQNEQVRRQSLAQAVEASETSAKLSKDLYAQGLAEFLNVIDSQRALYATQDALVQSDTAVITDLIALYKALGGGWDAPDFPATQPAETALAQ